MRSLFIVIYYTILQTVKKKSFWVTNCIMAFVLFLFFALISEITTDNITLPNSTDDKGLLQQTYEAMQSAKANTPIENHQELEKKYPLPKILVVDQTSMFGNYLESLYNKGYNFIISNSMSKEMDIETVKQEINDEQLYAAIILNESDGLISFDYMVLENSNYNKLDANLISAFLKEIQIAKTLDNYNISEEHMNFINTPIEYEINILKDYTAIDNATIVSIFLSTILFFAIYFYSFSVSASISSEKTSRVIETLVASTSPKHVIIGKTTAMGILGLLQLVFLCIICVISYRFFISSDLSFLNNLIESVNFSTINIIILVIYFILGYVLFAFLNAITGATVSKPEDIQIANIPISLIFALSFVLSFFALDSSPNSNMTFATMFPFSSPFGMPSRLLLGYASTAEITLSLLILISTVILLAFISIRIYSVAILHYGNRLRFKDLFNMFVKIK